MSSAQTIRQFRVLALASYLGLLALMLIWQLTCNCASSLSLSFRLSFWVVPLLFPLYGIIRGHAYTHAWANFVLMWYFLHSLTMLYVDPLQRDWAIAELILTSMAFVGCTGYARSQGRALGLGLKPLKQQD
jgi:uncharacterized membrane protein